MLLYPRDKLTTRRSATLLDMAGSRMANGGHLRTTRRPARGMKLANAAKTFP